MVRHVLHSVICQEDERVSLNDASMAGSATRRGCGVLGFVGSRRMKQYGMRCAILRDSSLRYSATNRLRAVNGFTMDNGGGRYYGRGTGYRRFALDILQKARQ